MLWKYRALKKQGLFFAAKQTATTTAVMKLEISIVLSYNKTLVLHVPYLLLHISLPSSKTTTT